MSNNVGSRPLEAGWYWFTGEVKHPRRGDTTVDEPLEIINPETGYIYINSIGNVSFDDMHGDFVPLDKPAVMPEPDWSQAPDGAQWWAVEYAYTEADLETAGGREQGGAE